MNPPQKGDDIRILWRHVAAQNAQIAALERQVRDLTLRLPKRTITPTGFHPFKIYQLPADMRVEPASDDWQKIRVRSGWCNGTWCDLDGAKTPESLELPLTLTDDTTPVPELNAYDAASYAEGITRCWFYLDAGARTVGTLYQANYGPREGHLEDLEIFANRIPLGYADISGNPATGLFIQITQIQVDNIAARNVDLSLTSAWFGAWHRPLDGADGYPAGALVYREWGTAVGNTIRATFVSTANNNISVPTVPECEASYWFVLGFWTGCLHQFALITDAGPQYVSAIVNTDTSIVVDFDNADSD